MSYTYLYCLNEKCWTCWWYSTLLLRYQQMQTLKEAIGCRQKKIWDVYKSPLNSKTTKNHSYYFTENIWRFGWITKTSTGLIIWPWQFTSTPTAEITAIGVLLEKINFYRFKYVKLYLLETRVSITNCTWDGWMHWLSKALLLVHWNTQTNTKAAMDFWYS